MAGKNPEEAMAAAIEHIPTQSTPAVETFHVDNTYEDQETQPHPHVSASGQTVPPTSSYSAGRLGRDRKSRNGEHKIKAEPPARQPPGKPRAGNTRSAGHWDGPSSDPSPPQQGLSQTQRGPTEFEARTIQDWKDNANNPKAETYRYVWWALDRVTWQKISAVCMVNFTQVLVSMCARSGMKSLSKSWTYLCLSALCAVVVGNI